MKRILQFYIVSTLVKIFEVVFPETTYACAVCFGARDSAMTLGLNWGIFALLVVIVSVLGAFGAFFIYLFNRAHKIEKHLKII